MHNSFGYQGSECSGTKPSMFYFRPCMAVKINGWVVLLLLLTQVALGQVVHVTPASGEQLMPFDVVLSCPECDAIFYTLDGSTPNPSSAQYTEPLESSKLHERPPALALVPSTAVPNVSGSATYDMWAPPGKVPMAIALSVRGYKKGKPVTPLRHATWFLSPQDLLLPTFSLFMQPDALLNPDTGIYVPGVHNEPGNTIWSGNFQQSGRKWERGAHLQFFSGKEQQLEQRIGVRIHGTKVAAAPQKSLRLYARKSYGAATFDYPFFGDSSAYKRLLLRSPYSAHFSTVITDAVAHELCRPLNLDIMQYQPTSAFVNGEYFGLYFLRERVDKHYLSQNFGVHKDSVLIQNSKDFAVFDSLLSQVETLDLSDGSSYAHVAGQVDIANFIDYLIAEVYFTNDDWLYNNNNITVWKPTQGGKWRFVLIDMDAGCHRPEQNMFDRLRYAKTSMVSRLYAKLLENPYFREKLEQRYDMVLGRYLTSERVEHVMDSIANELQPSMDRQIQRWWHPGSRDTWSKARGNLRTFARTRSAILRKQLASEYIRFDFEYRGVVPEGY